MANKTEVSAKAIQCAVPYLDLQAAVLSPGFIKNGLYSFKLRK